MQKINELTNNRNKEGFTGGEWIVDDRENGLFIEAIIKYEEYEEETSAVGICKMYGKEPIDKRDAALIAQAKNMYESLKKMVEFAEIVERHSEHKCHNLSAAKEILKKANQNQ